MGGWRYVFDGKAPDLKKRELDSRREMKEAAEKELKEAKEAGDEEKVANALQDLRIVRKLSDRLVKC